MARNNRHTAHPAHPPTRQARCPSARTSHFLLPFPTIYLDNNATTRPAREVVEAVARAMTEQWANPSSVHRAGQDARHAVELARASVAALIGARPKSITFTSGGTEAIDLAIRGTLASAPTTPRVVSTAIEHAAVRDLLQQLSQDGAITLDHLAIDRAGIVTPDSIERAIAPGTRLVTVQWANNETGAVQPVAAIAARCRAVGAIFHCDATQWVGKMPIDVGEMRAGAGTPPPPCDLLTCSAHKWHGPKGVGVLWMRTGQRLAPRIVGTQEKGRRGGTEHTEGIIGAGVAAALAKDWLADPAGSVGIAALRDRLEARILKENPGATVNGPTDADLRLWNTTNIAFPRLEAEALLMAFSERGLCASAGAACSSGSLDPSPVLLAMGIPPALAHGSIRFSLSRHTTEAEVDEAAAIVAACVARVGSSMTG